MHKHFLKKTNLLKECMKKFIALVMTEKQPRINGKMMTDFLVALYSAYKKLRQFFFHTLLLNLFKQRYIRSVKSYEHLNKLINEK